MKSIKVVIYCRVSLDRREYTRQIEAITKYCKFNEYTIVGEFCEKETGKHKLRPELISMMEYLKLNSDVSFVVIDELSRIGRTSYVLETIEQLNAVKIGLISLKENLTTLNEDKTVNATATMITGVLASINSYELDTLNYRIKSGLLSSVDLPAKLTTPRRFILTTLRRCNLTTHF
ncbi:MAG TPA: recombinase family protein [Prolixibacteraceae bacterium]|nr:recombinase family protein [Prolixibacteraceae bacterium]